MNDNISRYSPIYDIKVVAIISLVNDVITNFHLVAKNISILTLQSTWSATKLPFQLIAMLIFCQITRKLYH